MERHEAEEVVSLLKAATGGRVEADQTEFFAAALTRLDYEQAMSAAVKGTITWQRFPSWAQFREMYAAGAPREELAKTLNMPAEEEKGRVIPRWVRRWIAARFLFTRWGRDQDMRPFQEQGPRLTSLAGEIEWMPEGEWDDVADEVSDRDVWGSLGA